MQRLIQHARERGLKELYGDVLAENARMIEMCRTLGFEIEASPNDREVCSVTLRL